MLTQGCQIHQTPQAKQVDLNWSLGQTGLANWPYVLHAVPFSMDATTSTCPGPAPNAAGSMCPQLALCIACTEHQASPTLHVQHMGLVWPTPNAVYGSNLRPTGSTED